MDEQEAQKEDKEDEKAIIGIFSTLEKEVNCKIKSRTITKWTSGIYLLDVFYKLIVSYILKSYLKNMILPLACKFLEGTGRILQIFVSHIESRQLLATVEVLNKYLGRE